MYQTIYTMCALVFGVTHSFYLHAGINKDCLPDNVYFHCLTESRTLTFCQSSSDHFQLIEKSDQEINVLFKTDNQELIAHDIYSRFRVMQTTISFKNDDYSYELYEYLNEESEEQLREIGMSIVTRVNKSTSNVVCDVNSHSNLIGFIQQ